MKSSRVRGDFLRGLQKDGTGGEGTVGRGGGWWPREGCHLHSMGPGVSWVSEGSSGVVVVAWIGELCDRERRSVKVKSLSRVRLLATPWAATHQASPSMGFARQEYWSGVPLPSPAFLSSSPELLGPGKSTKRRPNRVCASEDYPSA